MARQFNGSNTRIRLESAVVSAAPFTMACWFNVTDALHTLMYLGDKDSDDNRYVLNARGDLTDQVEFIARTTANTAVSTAPGAYTPGVWTHACGVEGSATDHRVYINGGNKGSSTTSRVPTGMDRTTVGVRDSLTNNGFTDGRIAEAVIWNVALTDAEVAIISRPGFPMHRYRPESIKLYWRLGVGSPEPDWSGNGNNGTLVNAPTIADHVGVAPPFGYDIWSPRSAAAISATPSAGVLSMAGIAPYLGFTINMPDEA
jgi:hypothetical protein